MSYSKARWSAAHCVASTTGGKIRDNAHDERRFYQAVAEHGGYGYGSTGSWIFKNSSTARRLGDRLVGKGLLVQVGEGRNVGYQLAPEPQAEFDRLVAVFERQEAEKEAAEEAEKQAAFAAHQAVLAQRQFVVVEVNLRNGTSRTVSEAIHSGYGGDAHARNEAQRRAEQADGQYKYLVVELASDDSVAVTA